MPELTIDCLSTVPSRDSGIGAVQCLFPESRITVRDLIALAVREQCAQLALRHADDLAEAACRLARQYLTRAEVAEQAAGGRVAPHSTRMPSARGLEVEREVTAAIRGFGEGAYIVLVGEHRCTSLDETVTLAITQPVRFIRMMPLAGADKAMSEVLDILKGEPALEGFDVRKLDRFVSQGLAMVDAIMKDKAGAAAADKLDASWAEYNNEGYRKALRPRTWARRMLAKLNAEDVRAGAMLFHLHQLAIQGANWSELGLQLVIVLRDNVDGLIYHYHGDRDDYPVEFDAAERGLLLASAMAIQACARKPEGWVPSFSADRDHWVSLEGPGAEPVMRALCRQLAQGRVWIHGTGLFEPEAKAPAVPCALKVDDLAPNWRYHLRSLVVQALTRGWITADEAERITGTHPLHEPWWLLSNTTAQMREMPPALRDFALRLRARFLTALRGLPGNAEPEKAIDIRYDRIPSEESYPWAEGESAELRGSAGLVAAARWAERHPERMGQGKVDPYMNQSAVGTHVMRRLAFIAGLDTSETPDAAVAALKEVPAKGLSLVLPWAHEGQPLVLKALGLESVERLRAWLLRHAGGDPAWMDRLGALLENTPDPRRDVVDVQELRAALQGVSPKEVKALLAPYLKVGMLSGADRLIAAALGETDRAKLADAAMAKEQQPAIKLLGLLPAAGEEDVRERYLLLQKIAKQATRHGAQRQATQRAAVEVGLAHLAQVAGYSDAAELEWTMEASQAETLRSSFTPRAIDGHEAWIAIEDLKPMLRVRNAAGKVLASVPPALKKHPDMKALAETFAEVKEQLRRFTRLMESRMTLEAPVSRAQLVAGLAHPVMAPIVRAIVWIDEAGQIGFLEEAGLTGPDGARAVSGERLRVAHSVHLLEGPDGAGRLSRWQRWLVDGRRVQAFKQVFREIYVPTPAELEAGEESSRYAGRRFGTRIAQGILQSRGWVAAPLDATEQRLLLRNGITATCGFAVGHFFTEDEDGETATMWFEREGRRIALKDVPAIAFSEAMRDIDLLVSRAILDDDSEGIYESAPTIEARIDLLRALSPALGAGVLEFQERHVLVKGQLASYRIHLASGHIHIEPGAYLCIIPDTVAARQRDAARLPFAEEDRKTAEIVSKVFLLARDREIKDESILAQIRRSGARAPA